MHRKLFISYRVADTRATAGRLAEALRRVFGETAVFLDYRNLDPAERWPEQLQREVANATVVLVLIGKDWLKVHDEYGRRRLDADDDWVRQEVAAALRGEAKVLPLRVNEAEPIPSAAIENLPDIVALATAQARRLRDVEWESDFAGLVDWLESQGFEPAVAVAAADDTEAAAPPWHGNPYRGLSAFGPKDGAIYHGRERDSEALLRRVENQRVVAVIGPSGSGKSSLVAAGLIPRLGKGWDWLAFSPAKAGPDPLLALARQLAPRLSDVSSAEDLAKRLHKTPEAIDELAAELLASGAAGAQLLLFVDQFEELFTARVDAANREPFVALVTAVGRARHTRLVLTMRADYTGHLTDHENLTLLIRDGTFLLGAPGVTALTAMIERPAKAAGLEVKPELTDRIIEDTGTEPGALALVEFTLEQLYEARSDGPLTLAAYTALDGVGGAIESQGERAVAVAGGNLDEATLGNVFRALASVDERGGAVRKPAKREELGERERAIVDRLVKARLLVADADAGGAATVEVAHEAVHLHWKRFRRWLDENRELELWRQRLEVYEQMDDAVESQGERAVGDASGHVDEVALSNVFRALTSVDEHGGAVRKRAKREVLGAGERAIADRLVDARLLVADTDTEGAATVEVAHEAVLRNWKRFRRWLDENRELELWRQRLGVYRQGGGSLPRGEPLVTARKWLEERGANLEDEERTYIKRSRSAARWYRGLLTVGVSVVLLAIAGVSAFTVWTANNGLNVGDGLTALALRVGLSGLTDVPLPEMVQIAEGSYLMGSPEDEEGRYSTEGPQRQVTVRAFKIGKTEVTFEQYDAFVEATGLRRPDDSGWGRKTRPIVHVSWEDAQAYAKWLSLMTGRRYRLPSEAEWEYAARGGPPSSGGTPTAYWWGDALIEGLANCDGCGSQFGGTSTAPVGSVKDAATQHPLGLWDTAGNVWEWVEDCWHDSYEGVPMNGSARPEADGGDCGRRVIRGGSWYNAPRRVRSAYRYRFDPDSRHSDLGFRLAQDL